MPTDTDTLRSLAIATLDALPVSAVDERADLCALLEDLDGEEAGGDPWTGGAEDWMAACRGAEATAA